MSNFTDIGETEQLLRTKPTMQDNLVITGCTRIWLSHNMFSVKITPSVLKEDTISIGVVFKIRLRDILFSVEKEGFCFCCVYFICVQSTKCDKA